MPSRWKGTCLVLRYVTINSCSLLVITKHELNVYCFVMASAHVRYTVQSCSWTESVDSCITAARLVVNLVGLMRQTWERKLKQCPRKLENRERHGREMKRILTVGRRVISGKCQLIGFSLECRVLPKYKTCRSETDCVSEVGTPCWKPVTPVSFLCRTPNL
jgi:hypothetical protein